MIQIPESRFRELKRKYPDFISRAQYDHEHDGRVCKRGDWVAFESVLTGNYSGGLFLIFEHIHFEIVKGE